MSKVFHPFIIKFFSTLNNNHKQIRSVKCDLWNYVAYVYPHVSVAILAELWLSYSQELILGHLFYVVQK